MGQLQQMITTEINVDTRYHATNWVDGDKVTADRLNKIELGICSIYENQEPFVVTFRNYVADKKYIDILNAYLQGKTILVDFTEDNNDQLFVAVMQEIGTESNPLFYSRVPYSVSGFFTVINGWISWAPYPDT